MKTQTAVISTQQTKCLQVSKQVVERERKTKKNTICRQVAWLCYQSETMPEAEKWLTSSLGGLTHISIYDRLLPTIQAQTDFVRGELTRNARKTNIKGLTKGSQAQGFLRNLNIWFQTALDFPKLSLV